MKRFSTIAGIICGLLLLSGAAKAQNNAPILNPITPQSVDEGSRLDVRVTATDPDAGDVISLRAENLPLNATFSDSTNGIGGLVFQPDYSQAGSYQIRIIASDVAGLADTEMADITVINVDQAPVIAAVPPQNVSEGGHLSLGIIATDPDGDNITLTAQQLPVHASFVDSTGGRGDLIFDPDYTQAGPFQVRIIANSNFLADTEMVDITVTNVDRKPVLAPISSQNVLEGGHLALRVTASDPDGDIIVLAADQLPSNSSFHDSTGGIGGFIFDPNFAQAGIYPIRFIAHSNSMADTQIVAVTVNNVDRKPVLTSIPAQFVSEGGHLALRVAAADPDGDAISLLAEQVPANASFHDSTGGVGGFIFDPIYTQAGSFSVRFIAHSNTLSDTQNVSITVANTDRPPVFSDVLPQSVSEGQTLTVNVSSSDPDGDIIALTNGTLPPHATFSDLGNGQGRLVFSPDLTQEGHYDISVYAASGSPTLRDTLIIAIDVLHVNAPPELAPIGPKSVNENQQLSFIVTASDIDGQIPSLVAQSMPFHAAFTDSLNGHGRFVFNPDYTQAGIYTVLFIARDGTLADSEYVTITVNNTNRPPVLNPIGNRSVVEGSTISFRISSSDPDLQIPALIAQSLPINAIFIDSTNGSGLFRFTPGYTQAGTYDIRFIASDGSLADSEIVKITVLEAGNQPPVIDSIGPQSVIEGQNLTLLIRASDPDSTIPALQAFNLPANSVFDDSGNGRASFIFNPNFSQSGIYNVLFRAYDGLRYDSLWVQITVIDFGFKPILNAIGPRSVSEGAFLQFVITSTDPDGTFPHLIASHIPIHGAFVDSLNGHGLFTFSPDFTQSGVDTVLFVASDGALADSEAVSITVIDVGNLPPVLAAIGPRSVNEADSLVFLISATDPDGNIPALGAYNLPLNATFIDNGNGSGRFRFLPSYFQAGVYNILFVASDGSLADSELVPVTVVNINRPPVLGEIGPHSVDEGGLLEFVVMSYDPDGSTPILTTSTLPLHATFVDSINGDGLFRFQPDFSQAGVYNIMFRASDGIAIDSELVEITVTSTNQPPAFDPLSNQFVFEGNALNLTVHAVDPDGPIPALSVLQLLRNSTFIDNHDGTGQFHYQPDFTQAGVDTVTFVASDGSASAHLIIQITTVDAGNQRPILASIGPRSINEGQVLLFNIHASDPDLNPIRFTALNMPLSASLHDSLDGTATFTFGPDFTQSGVDVVLFIASDGTLADSEYVTITVNNVNQRPVIAAIGPRSVNEGDSLIINISATDPDNDILNLRATNLISHMTFTDNLNGTGRFTFNPDFVQSGVYFVTFYASDSTLSDSQRVQITVNDAGNQPPRLAAIDTAYYVTEGAVLQFGVSASDPDGNQLTLSASPLITNMQFLDYANGTGQFTFSPNFAQAGIYSVTFRVFDGAAYDSARSRIYVADQGNQYPVLNPIGPRAIAEGGVLTIDISATDPEGFMPLLFIDNPLDSSTFVDNRNGTGRFVYYPTYYAAGSHTVRFIAMDNGGLIDYEDVVIAVSDVNRPPTIIYRGDTLVAEGATLVATVIVNDTTDYQPGVLSLTHGYMPSNANLAITDNGVGRFTFQPNYNQAGVDSAYFVGFDSDVPPLSANRWIRFRITNTNRKPILPQPPPSEMNQGDSLVINISATDPDGDPVTLFINGNSYPIIPPNSEFHDLGGGIGRFIFRPDYTQSGLFIINFAATDGQLAETRPTLILVHDLGNQRPTLNHIAALSLTEGQSLAVHLTSTDPDSTRPALTLVGRISNMTFVDSTNGAGSLEFTALYNQAGTYSLTFIASDGELADSEIVSLTVLEAGNQPPILSLITDRSVTEGSTLRFSVVAADPDSTIPVLAARNLPTHAAFADSGNGHGGFTFSPDFNQAGIYHVRFIAFDNIDPALADSQDVTITVVDYNRYPTIEDIPSHSINEGETLAFTVRSHDPDSTLPILITGHIPPNSSFIDNNDGTGSFTFTPSYSQAGLDSARFYAVDRMDPSKFATTRTYITIINVNRPPVMVPIADTSIGDGFLLTINLVATDPDSVFPILFLRGKPDSATFVDHGNGTGQFRWRPRYADIGFYHLFFGCRDRANTAISDSQLVQIEVVSAGNHPPVFTQIARQQLRDGDTLNLSINASDFDHDSLTITHVGILPYGMVFNVISSGHASIFWVPAVSQGGDTLVTLVAADPYGLTDTLRLSIHVITFIRGDANGSGTLNGVDVIFLVNYLKGGPAPDPLESGDANGNNQVNGLDVVYLINYFKGGPPPPPVPPIPGGEPGLKSKSAEVHNARGM
jgi:PKD repeat protein